MLHRAESTNAGTKCDTPTSKVEECKSQKLLNSALPLAKRLRSMSEVTGVPLIGDFKAFVEAAEAMMPQEAYELDLNDI